MFRTFMKNQRLTGKDFDPTAPCNKESDFTFIFDHWQLSSSILPPLLFAPRPGRSIKPLSLSLCLCLSLILWEFISHKPNPIGRDPPHWHHLLATIQIKANAALLSFKPFWTSLCVSLTPQKPLVWMIHFFSNIFGVWSVISINTQTTDWRSLIPSQGSHKSLGAGVKTQRQCLGRG